MSYPAAAGRRTSFTFKLVVITLKLTGAPAVGASVGWTLDVLVDVTHKPLGLCGPQRFHTDHLPLGAEGSQQEHHRRWPQGRWPRSLWLAGLQQMIGFQSER